MPVGLSADMLNAVPFGDRDLGEEMASIYVPHTRFVALYDRIGAAIRRHRRGRKSSNLHVTGPSFTGKSTLIEKLATDFPSTPDVRRFEQKGIEYVSDDRPLIVVEMPGEPTLKALLKRIIKQYTSDTDMLKGEVSDLEDRVVLLAARCGTIVILIDETQRAVDTRGVADRDRIAEWLKSAPRDTGALMLLFGLRYLRFLFLNDRQVENRWGAELRFDPYEWVNKKGEPNLEDQGEFLGAVRSLIEASPVPFSDDVNLQTSDDDLLDDAALRYYYVGQGKLGPLKSLAKRANEVVQDLGDQNAIVDRRVLEVAYAAEFGRERGGYRNHVNPFSDDWQRQLPPVDDDNMPADVGRKGSRKERRARAMSALTK